MVQWNGIDFKEKGIIVESPPKISKAKKKINIYEVEGRNGFLSVDTGVYESFVVSVECHAKETTNFDDIKSFLDGYGTLSFDGKREYKAIIQNSISFEKVLMFKKFIVQFLVNPIAEDKDVLSYYVQNANDILEISDANANMYPTIEITGTGNISITINSKSFNLKEIDGKYILDCKQKIITHNDLNASNKMQYDFPYLIPGNNSISYVGNVTEFKVAYRKAYL